MQEHSLKIFSLALLGIKIPFLYIMLESIFKNPFHGWMHCYVCKCRRKWIIFLRKILFLSCFLEENPIFVLFFGVATSYFPIFLTCPITWHPGSDFYDLMWSFPFGHMGFKVKVHAHTVERSKE